MKKRITCFLLALLMVLSILPPQTFAADAETTSEGQSVVECYATVKSTFSGYAYGTPGVFMSAVSCNASFFPALVVITAVQNVDGTDYYQLRAADNYEWTYGEGGGIGDGIWMKAEYIDVQLPEEPDAPTDPSETTDPSTSTEPSDPVDPNAPSISATVTDANGNPVLDANGNPQTVTVSGNALPEGATLHVAVGTQAQMDAFGGSSENHNLYVYNIELIKDGTSVQPNGKVKVTISNVELFEKGYVDIFHILDDADAIRNGIAKNTAFPADETTLADVFPVEAALAEEITGKSGVIYVEEFSTADDTVTVSVENNSISFYLTSFSTIAAANGNITASGTTITVSDDQTHTRYVLPGSTLSFYRNNIYVSWYWNTSRTGVSATSNGEAVTTSTSDCRGGGDKYQNCTVTIGRNASGTAVLQTRRGITYGSGTTTTLNIVVVTDAVSYNANGGTGAPGSQTKYHNENLTLSTDRPTRTGYIFLGWHSSADNKIYQPGGIYSLNQATVMTALWGKSSNATSGWNKNFYILPGTTSASFADELEYIDTDRTSNKIKGDSNTYYIAPGTTVALAHDSGMWRIDAAKSGLTLKAGSATASASGWTAAATNATLTVSATAAEGTTMMIYVRDAAEPTEVSCARIVVDKISDITAAATNDTQGVYRLGLFVLCDSTKIPGEPNYTITGDMVNFENKGMGYKSSASGMIEPGIGTSAHFDSSQDGSCTMGIVDYEGFETIDHMSQQLMDDAMATVIFGIKNGKKMIAADGTNLNEYYNQKGGDNGGADAIRENFSVRPYVTKLMTGLNYTDLGWHIDFAIYAKNTVTVNYNLNTPQGYGLKTIGTPAPGIGQSEKTEVSIAVTKDLEVNKTYTAYVIGATDTASLTFKGWNTRPDGAGASYAPGSIVSISESMTLYAQWEGGSFSTGTLEIHKKVEVAANSQQPNADDIFTFSVNLEGSWPYAVYNVTTAAQIGTGTMTNGTVTLKAGQFIRFTQVPLGTYTVKETNLPANYTPDKSDYTFELKGGYVNQAIFINTYKNLIAYTVQGSISNGTITGNSNQNVTHGQKNTEITFTPNTGYEITQIAVTTNGNTTYIPVLGNENGYTYSAYVVTGDVTIVVSTAKKIYTVTGSIDHGTVTPAMQDVNHGENANTMTFTPATGYKITGITVTIDGNQHPVNVTSSIENGYTYTATNVTAPVSIDVTTTLKTYAVTGIIDNGGSVTNYDQSVTHGNSSAAMVFTPTTGYKITKITVNGKEQSVTDEDNYTYPAQTAVTGDIQVVVTTVIKTFDVTATIDDGGTITGTFPKTVDYGAVVEIGFTPKPGYKIKSVKVNGTIIATFDERGDELNLEIKEATDIVITTEQNVFTVTFKDWNDTVLESKKWTYGETPYYDADDSKDGLQNPVRASDEQYDYEFAGWTPQISAVTGNVTYKATYTSHTRSYTITWVDGDGKTLHTETWAYNTMPQYTGSKTPTKTATAQYTYTFNNKWSPEIAKVTGNATYTAQFDATINKYPITWIDGDGNTLKTEQVEYGKTPVYEGDEPTKTATAQYTYTFNNAWSPAITAVTGPATYTAQFDSEVNKYTITWIDGDGNTLKTEEVPYGDTPAYTGATPTKKATAQYSYIWDNTWSPAIVSVTGDATYTAQFTQSIRTYTVTWKNWDDTVLKTDTVAYNLKLTYNGTKPSRAETQQYWYNFEGWNGSDGSQIDAYEEITVTGDITYTAILNPKLMEYYVIWVVEGVEKDKDLWKYGDTPTYSGETPTKAEDDGYTYQWKGEWTPVVVPVVDTVTYEAIFKESVKIFSITYDLDGGALPADKNNPASYHVEKETFLLNEPERTGYTFTGWTGSNGDTPQTQVSVEKGTTGNLTFTANWQAENVGYKVVHWQQAIGGGSEHNETNFLRKETENLIAETDSKVTPNVKNYEGFTAPTEVEVTIAADGSTVVNYYYTRNTYIIRFNANEGTGTMDSLTLAYNQSAKLTANAFARKGYSFKGWATTAAGTVAYADQADVKNLAVEDGKTIDLYAVWEINLFNLIIKTNNTVDENQSYIFTVSGTGYDGTEIQLQVALGANDEQKIVGVPAGIYTVADQHGWSWRYEHQEIEDREVVTDQVADFNYTYSRMIDTKIYWLNGYGNDLLRLFDNKRKK